MSASQLVDRILCSEANIDLWKLRTGRLSDKGEDNDFTKIQEAMGILSDAPIFIDDTAASTVLEIKTKARRLQSEHDLGLIVIDYIQLINPTGSQSNPVQQMTEISRSLKALARELDIPVLAISQLSRASEQREDKRPRLSDLRESGSLEQDADVVLLIFREDLAHKNSEKKNIAEIIIAKHRNGPTGSVELYFNQDKVSFQNLAKQYDE
jgi:replicative DNA helicase